jgi:hypothetical protein
VTRRCPVDQRVDLDPVPDDGSDQFAGEIGGHRIAFRIGEMALEDRLGGPLSEVGLEDRGERESAAGAAPPLAVSLRRHRR